MEPPGRFRDLNSEFTFKPGTNMLFDSKTLFDMNLDCALEAPAGVRGFPARGLIVLFTVALLL